MIPGIISRSNAFAVGMGERDVYSGDGTRLSGTTLYRRRIPAAYRLPMFMRTTEA